MIDLREVIEKSFFFFKWDAFEIFESDQYILPSNLIFHVFGL